MHTAEHQLTKPISRHKCLLRAHSHRTFFGHPHTVEERCTVTYIILVKEVYIGEIDMVFSKARMFTEAFKAQHLPPLLFFFLVMIDLLSLLPGCRTSPFCSSALSQACSGAGEKLCL